MGFRLDCMQLVLPDLAFEIRETKGGIIETFNLQNPRARLGKIYNATKASATVQTVQQMWEETISR